MPGKIKMIIERTIYIYNILNEQEIFINILSIATDNVVMLISILLV